MKLSVVILNYNVRYFLELCLKSVREAIKNIEAEIIVVDNNSEDGSCEMVNELFPEAILIENKENFGFSKGNNIGVAQAKGNFICILNPDTVLPEDVFEKLLAFSENKENLGIVGCKLISGKGGFLPESKRNIPYVKAALKKILGNSKDYYATSLQENEVGKVDILVGAFMFMKRKIYDEVEGFDEDYFMYGEDIDISYKVFKSGYDNYYFGDAKIIHFKGESTLRDKFYVKRFYGAMQIFYNKHFKKNMAFNLFVWFGIKLAYLLRRNSVVTKKVIEGYFFISNRMQPRLEKALFSKITLKSELSEQIPDFTEIIFDGNFLTYKAIIDMFEKNNNNKTVTYKILPKDSNFIIGSDSMISRGEIVSF